MLYCWQWYIRYCFMYCVNCVSFMFLIFVFVMYVDVEVFVVICIVVMCDSFECIGCFDLQCVCEWFFVLFDLV